MKYIDRLILILIFTACSGPKTNEQVDQSDQSSKPLQSDYSSTDSNDFSSYVGYIMKFEDNGSFYTDIYFDENVDYKDYEKISKLGDSIMFKDEETTRTRLTLNVADQYFNLSGLSGIKVFDKTNRVITSGNLSHVEYVEDMIESRFVAVFDLNNSNITDYQFCISDSEERLRYLNYSSIEDTNLTSRLIDFLNIKTDHIWNVAHYKLEKSDTIYSTVSVDPLAYVLVSVDNNFKLLYKSESSEVIMGLLIVSKEVNGRPIFLVDAGLPESDVMWTSLLTYNGSEYIPSKYQRIKSEKYGR